MKQATFLASCSPFSPMWEKVAEGRLRGSRDLPASTLEIMTLREQLINHHDRVRVVFVNS
jgi:hypothetical protein